MSRSASEQQHTETWLPNNSAVEPNNGEEYVRWAYRLLLGREPESPERIKNNPFKNDRRRLVQLMLCSKEFEPQLVEILKLRSTQRPTMRELPMLDYSSLLGDPLVPTVAPIGIKQGSRICRHADLSTDAFRYWISRMQYRPKMDRKLWEWFFIADALFQRNQLRTGRTGIGFGVGREPLTALFASFGCDVLATDLPSDRASSEGWVRTGQHALRDPKICEENAFARRVTFRALDMNDIPIELDGQFDFCWSSCALEHLGSLEHGLRFVERAMALLKPNGIAVHTTEYNITSNADTLETPQLSLYRRRDINELTMRLSGNGHQIEPIDYDQGHGYADGYVDLPPYKRGPLHLRLKLAAYTCTSIGLIIHKGGSVSSDTTDGDHR